MPNTFTKIASVTVGAGGASTIDFTSIPSTYTDLCLKLSLRSVASAVADTTYIYVNSGTSGSARYLSGNGSAASSGTGVYMYAGDIPAASATANTFSNIEIYFPNYTSSNYKSFSSDSVGENNATTAYAQLWANLWSNTAAINAITFDAASNFAQYSTATLYGIKKD